MTFSAYVPLAAALLNAVLTVFVFRAGVQASSRLAYFIWGVSIVVWNLGTFEMFNAGSRSDALEWASFLQVGVIFLPTSLFHLCLQMCQIRRPKLIGGAYMLGMALTATIFSGHFVANVRDAGYAWYTVGGPAFWVFACLYSLLTISTVIVLWKAQKVAVSLRKGQIRSLLWATGTLIIGGYNDILPILGVYHYPILNTPIFPFGSLCAIFYGILVGYSVLQHQLLDVQVGLSEATAHAVRLAFLLLIGLMLLLGISIIAPTNAMTPFAFWASLGVLFVSGLTASVFMPKLLGGANEALQRRLLGDQFETRDKVRLFIEQCRWHHDLHTLLPALHSLLVNVVGVRSYCIILLDETNRAFTLTRAHPEQPQRQLPDLASDSPIFRLFTEKHLKYVRLETSRGASTESATSRQAQNQLGQFSGDIVFPLLVENQPLGMLILGRKVSGETYARADSQLFASLTENLALVINQISLKNQLLLNQELDLLGRMSRGMAHDLNNLTTPVWTLLQLVGEGTPTEALREDLLPVALKNLDTMRAYIKESLFFSEHMRPDFQLGRLDVVVRQSVDLARENKRNGKNISFIVETEGEVLVEMDSVQIKRLLSNVLANAVDASSDGGAIRVEIIRLVKTEAARDWIRIRIIDQGVGIPIENLNRIFQPYFTTKKTGDEARGFGLGLAICRKIATLHGGYLTVNSEPGKGTDVALDLPNRRKQDIAESPSPQPQDTNKETSAK